MTSYVNITATAGSTSNTGTVTISDKNGNGKIYVCNKDAAITDRASNSLAKGTVVNADMYFLSKSTYVNGEIVYFNPTTGKVCTDYTTSQSASGINSGCMKWYAFNDTGGEKINLLLDHNIRYDSAWASTDNNHNGPDTLLSNLKSDTSSWTGVETPTNYTYTSTYSGNIFTYTINYSGYNARLITAQEIANIVGASDWNESSSTTHFYFDTGNSTSSSTCYQYDTSGCKYAWLYDGTGSSCYGCSNPTGNGYFTASARSNGTTCTWIVSSEANIWSYCGLTTSISYEGIRPIIKVQKSKLK